MSRAFTKEEDTAKVAAVVAPRAPLPAGVPNYVTPRGLGQLQSELDDLILQQRARAGDEVLAARRFELEQRLASAVVVDIAAQPRGEVRFGAKVTVRADDGALRVFQIVGVDEADAAQGRIAFTAPLARALLGKAPGDVATVRAPRGDEELEVVSVSYMSD